MIALKLVIYTLHLAEKHSKFCNEVLFVFTIVPFFDHHSSLRQKFEEVLNEKRKDLHPPQPEFSQEDMTAHAIAMFLHRDFD